MRKKDAVWITGASSGIGLAITKKISQLDYNIIASARRVKPIEKISNELNLSSKILAVQNDISDFADLNKKISKIKNEYNINCLVNNAGISSFKPFAENTIEEIDQIIKVNLLGSIYATKLVLPEMILNKSGTIINILSVAAIKTLKNSTIYAASKSGLDYFSRDLREEVREHNIKIINIFPGATSTEIWPEKVLAKYSSKMMNAESIADFISNLLKIDGNMVPEEIVLRPITGDL